MSGTGENVSHGDHGHFREIGSLERHQDEDPSAGEDETEDPARGGADRARGEMLGRVQTGNGSSYAREDGTRRGITANTRRYQCHGDRYQASGGSQEQSEGNGEVDS